MQFGIVTALEAIGAIIGIVFLGIVGTMVTPREAQVHPVQQAISTPEEVIDHAEEGYQVDTCVRTISPYTVLSAGASGTPDLTVVEGAPVSDCFPGLSDFITGGASQEGKASRPTPFSRGNRAPGTDLSTSVTVLPLSSGSTTALSASSSTPVEKRDTSHTATSSPAPVPSGGGTASWEASIPSVDRFEACRIRLFGEVIPTEVTAEENTAFEQCLAEESVPAEHP